jgi:ubiquinol-cytochrome c reductase cytochrome b subunit
MSLTFLLVTLANGGNDIIATHFALSINEITWFDRIGILILPPIAFLITKRICLSLQRADRELILHGRETGQLVRLPHGEFVEVHEPVSPEQAWTLTQHEQRPALDLKMIDKHGVRRPGGLRNKIRSRFSQAVTEQVPKPEEDDLKEIEHH